MSSGEIDFSKLPDDFYVKVFYACISIFSLYVLYRFIQRYNKKQKWSTTKKTKIRELGLEPRTSELSAPRASSAPSPLKYHPQVSILCLPFNEKEITIKLSDIVSVLIVFDDKPPAMGVVLVWCCVFTYVRHLAMTSSFCKAAEL